MYAQRQAGGEGFPELFADYYYYYCGYAGKEGPRKLEAQTAREDCTRRRKDKAQSQYKAQAL